MALGLDPIILTGNLKIGASSTTAFEVGDNVTGMKLTGTRAIIEIPSTLATTTSSRRAGQANYELQVDYMPSDDATTTAAFNLFWNALADVTAGAEGQLYFEGSMRAGSVSTSNPKWSGTIIVTGAAIGGTANELATDSQTFPLTAAPTRSNS